MQFPVLRLTLLLALLQLALCSSIPLQTRHLDVIPQSPRNADLKARAQNSSDTTISSVRSNHSRSDPTGIRLEDAAVQITQLVSKIKAGHPSVQVQYLRISDEDDVDMTKSNNLTLEFAGWIPDALQSVISVTNVEDGLWFPPSYGPPFFPGEGPGTYAWEPTRYVNLAKFLSDVHEEDPHAGPWYSVSVEIRPRATQEVPEGLQYHFDTPAAGRHELCGSVLTGKVVDCFSAGEERRRSRRQSRVNGESGV